MGILNATPELCEGSKLPQVGRGRGQWHDRHIKQLGIKLRGQRSKSYGYPELVRWWRLSYITHTLIIRRKACEQYYVQLITYIHIIIYTCTIECSTFWCQTKKNWPWQKKTGKAKKNCSASFFWSLGGLYNIKLAQSSLQAGAAFAFWL